jgi:hypothetical protein
MKFQIECPKDAQRAWPGSLGFKVNRHCCSAVSGNALYYSAMIHSRLDAQPDGPYEPCMYDLVRSLLSCRPIATDRSSVSLREVLLPFRMLPLGRLCSVKAGPGKENMLWHNNRGQRRSPPALAPCESSSTLPVLVPGLFPTNTREVQSRYRDNGCLTSSDFVSKEASLFAADRGPDTTVCKSLSWITCRTVYRVESRTLTQGRSISS